MDDKTLDRLHEALTEIYLEIKRLCDKYGLIHFAVGGTLLGAVVHRGFVPWDDDIDIAMPRADYEAFIRICRKELDSRYFLHHQTTDPDYWLSFAKVRKNNTLFIDRKGEKVSSHAGIWVDVFPFDSAARAGGPYHRLKWKAMTYLNNYIFSRITQAPIRGWSSRVSSLCFSRIPAIRLSNFRDRVMMSFRSRNPRFFLDLAGGRALGNSYFEISRMLPQRELPFGEITVPVPNDPDYYLLQLYGNKYKVIPPEGERVTHEPLRISFDVEAEGISGRGEVC